MQRVRSAESQIAGRYDTRLATKITDGVDRRLRMLALVSRRPLNHVLVSLLDQALPSADELAARLGGGYDGDPEAVKAVA